MALTRAKKKQKVQVLAKELATSTTAIIGTFAKMTVAQDFELRKVVRGAGGKYRVLKNKLAAKAGEGTKVEAALKGLKGVSAVAFTSGDPVELAKVFSKWVGDNAQFTFKLGIVDGKLISVEEVKALATMPAKEELYAKLLFLISSPAQRLVTVLNAAGRDLAVVVNEAVKAEKFKGAAEVPAKVAAPVAGAAVPDVTAVAPEVQAEAPAPAEQPETEAAPIKADVVPVEAEAARAETPEVEAAAAEPQIHAEAAAEEGPAEGAEAEIAATEAALAASDAPVETVAVEEAPVDVVPIGTQVGETVSVDLPPVKAAAPDTAESEVAVIGVSAGVAASVEATSVETASTESAPVGSATPADGPTSL